MLIQYIETNGPKLDSIVLRGISTSIGLISKLSWISDRRHRSLFESIEAIIDLKGPYLVVGLNMMSDFVEQMNLPGTCTFIVDSSPQVDNTDHRKTATQFMSENLLDIFQYALSVIQSIHDNDPAFADPQYRQTVLQSTLDILSKCLQFDFTGCTGDDGSDEMWVLQLPQLWEGPVCNSKQLYVFFDLFVNGGRCDI
jgi:singapore isolate B (sub-type 7) whole genome shotgun sequence assembly, scaffold_14